MFESAGRNSQSVLFRNFLTGFKYAACCVVFIVAGCVLTLTAAAEDLKVDELVTLNPTGSYEEFTIPTVTGYNKDLTLVLVGGDGGRRVVPFICREKGGQGATVQARFAIGTDPGQLQPGGRVRFIFGERGGSVRSGSKKSGSGGGGTAVLYTIATDADIDDDTDGCSEPSMDLNDADTCWVMLAVAGGGGGASLSGGCVGSSGRGGNDGEAGRSGKGASGNGGVDGEGGRGQGSGAGGPGGGFLGDGDMNNNGPRRFAGKKGGLAGGDGGESGSSILLPGIGGGFGYGGGGGGSGAHENALDDHYAAGGGGGGFSGGGPGGKNEGGGGGGSFLNSAALESSYKSAGGTDGTPDGGSIRYGITRRFSEKPVAVTKDIIKTLDASGQVEVLASDVDAGSSGPFEVLLKTRFEYPTGTGNFVNKIVFDCNDVGSQTVTFCVQTVFAGQVLEQDKAQVKIEVENGHSPVIEYSQGDVEVTATGDSCVATVTVLDIPTLVSGCNVTLYYMVDHRPANGDPTEGTWTEGLPGDLTVEVGSATVTYRGEDAWGNVSEHVSFDINVIDDGSAPVASCQDITIQLDSDGTKSITAGDIDNSSYSTVLSWCSVCLSTTSLAPTSVTGG